MRHERKIKCSRHKESQTHDSLTLSWDATEGGPPLKPKSKLKKKKRALSAKDRTSHHKVFQTLSMPYLEELRHKVAKVF